VTAPGPDPGWRVARWPFPAGTPLTKVFDPATPPSRTWLEAATAIPDRCWVRPATTPGRPAYARVYRTTDPELGACWHWRCSGCGTQSLGCAHTVLHEPGTWRAAFCGGFHHVHTEHERRPATQGEHPHDTIGSRRRCDWSPPDQAHLRLAALVLCGRTGYPRGDRARAMAREVLALAGRRTP
jgi:hypothetical protein